jgi:hypothetical protein
MVCRDAWKRTEVVSLKFLHFGHRDVSMFCHGSRRAKIITSMAELFVQIPVRVITVKLLIGNGSVAFGIARPGQMRSGHPTYLRMKIARLAESKIRTSKLFSMFLNEPLPTQGAKVSGVGLL